MTTNPLDAIQARANAATEGPWEVPHSCDPHVDKVEAPSDSNLVGPICEVRSPQQNAVFIAHAREDVPRLVCVIRAVEATMDDLDVARTEGRIHTYGQIQKAVRDAIREALG